jgi:hypothetical protein
MKPQWRSGRPARRPPAPFNRGGQGEARIDGIVAGTLT